MFFFDHNGHMPPAPDKDHDGEVEIRLTTWLQSTHEGSLHRLLTYIQKRVGGTVSTQSGTMCSPWSQSHLPPRMEHHAEAVLALLQRDYLPPQGTPYMLCQLGLILPICDDDQ